jgi:hypothetical protein
MSLQRTVRTRKLEICIQRINYFKRGYQPRSKLLKDDNGDLLAESHNILNGWKDYFSQLLIVHSISDVRQLKIHTADPLIPDPHPSEVEIAIVKLKSYESPGSVQIPTEPTQARDETLQSEIHKLITYIWNKEELPYQ